MNCPHCHKPDTKVIDSRPTEIQVGRNALDSPAIRRRRKCLSCEHQWTTYEVAEGTWMGHKGKRSLSAIIGQSKRRGFIVPPHMRADYYNLRQNKRMTAIEAAHALGIMDKDGVVKRKYLPPKDPGGSDP